jgi:phosphopantetheine--protein transferase-like protein
MVGIDIEEVERFKNLDKHLMERVYTKSEIEYCQKFINPENHFAGFWCAKEAVVKSLNLLNFTISEIEILHNSNGAPYINVGEKLKQYFNENNIKNIHISISHTKTYATAVAMIEINK